jgi:G3E family GTPase
LSLTSWTRTSESLHYTGHPHGQPTSLVLVRFGRCGFSWPLTNAMACVRICYIREHIHDQTIVSVGITESGDLDMDKMNGWLGTLLREKGVDIYRMKGVLAIKGQDQRFVFQGIHMLFDGQPMTPWGDEPRTNKMIFIGKNLDREELTSGFMSCMAS